MKQNMISKIVQTAGHLYCGLVAVIASFIIKVKGTICMHEIKHIANVQRYSISYICKPNNFQ